MFKSYTKIRYEGRWREKRLTRWSRFKMLHSTFGNEKGRVKEKYHLFIFQANTLKGEFKKKKTGP